MRPFLRPRRKELSPEALYIVGLTRLTAARAASSTVTCSLRLSHGTGHEYLLLTKARSCTGKQFTAISKGVTRRSRRAAGGAAATQPSWGPLCA